MGATFSRLKNWAPEVLTNTDLNAEIDNILNNLTPSGIDGYSTTATQMKITTNPGSTGSESLATSTAGEFERLRYQIKAILGTGVTNWYDAPSTSLTNLVTALGAISNFDQNRIVSGLTTGNSSQLNCLIPAGGSTASLTLTASVTNPFVYVVQGTQYNITSSVTISGLALATAANSTVDVLKANMTGNVAYAKVLGMYGIPLTTQNMGSGASALVGQIAAFSATASSTTEYFIAQVNSTNSLANAWRGGFFNSAGAGVPAVSFATGDHMLLNKLAWIFANTNMSLAVTYNNPTLSGVQPSAPAVNDYWFDMSATAWKVYSGTSWGLSNSTLIGMSIQSSVGCVAARTLNSFKATSELQTLKLENVDINTVQAQNMFGQVSVYGRNLNFGTFQPKWSNLTNLEAGLTLAPNTLYYMYLTENGSAMMTTKAPIHRPDLGGLYYPTETWRCIGSDFCNSSTNMEIPARTFRNYTRARLFLADPDAYRTTSISNSFLASTFMQFPTNFGSYVYYAANTAATTFDNTGSSSLNILSMALPAGLYQMSGTVLAQGLSPNNFTATILHASISTSSQTSDASGFFDSDVYWNLTNTESVSNHCSGTLPNCYVTLTTPSTVYMKVGFVVTSTNKTAAFNAQMSALRLDELGNA